MNDSILNSTKKLLGLDEAYTAFDLDVIVHLNSTFAVLHQLGVGPEESFAISGATETWDDFLGTIKNVNSVKTYVYLRVRMFFDPPATSFALSAMKEQITEFEWRLNLATENYDYKEVVQ